LKVKQLVLINLSHKIVNRKKFVGEEHQQRRKQGKEKAEGIKLLDNDGL